MPHKLTKYYLHLLTLLFLNCQSSSTSERKMAADSSFKISPDTIDLSTFDPEDEILGVGVPQFGDLDSMIARRRIRALVPYTRTFYYIDGKERSGIAFEALNLFEKSLNKQLGFHPPRVRIIFIPVSRQQIIPLLNQGYGDLAFAGITVTPEREKIIDFSTPTITGLKEIVVGGPAAPKLQTMADLSGQQVYVHAGSSYESSLLRLSDSLKTVGLDPIQIEPIDPYLEVEDILEMTNSGLIPLTVMVEDAARQWAEVLDSLTLFSDLVVSKNVTDAWAFRKNSPQLKSVADQFLRQNAKGSLIGNMLYNKYLKRKTNLLNVYSPKALVQLKSTELIFKKYADMYNVDWLLLVAQAYQESQLDQSVVSSAGAVGVMQIKPSTAAHDPINISNINTLDNNVHAGAKYMRHLIDHYFNDDTIGRLDKGLFALAAYNAGPSRIAQLRRDAAARGLNANQWFNNVEMVAAQEIGRETVQYVSNIYKYYTSYRSLKHYSERSGKTILPK